MAAKRDWPKFRSAYRRGLPHAELWERLELADAWTSLPLPEALEALRAKQNEPVRAWFEALNVLYFKWYRKTGYGSDQSGQQAVQALWQRIAAGTEPEPTRTVGTRLWLALQLLSDLLTRFPNANRPDPGDTPEKTATLAAATALSAKLSERPPAIAGFVTTESICALENLRDEFAQLIQQTDPRNGGLLSYVFDGSAHTESALAKSYLIAGRPDDAQQAFTRSAMFFERAGAPEKAIEIRAKAALLSQQLAGRFDADTAVSLTALHELESQQSDFARLRKIGSLIELSRVAASAFDGYEALKQAKAATLELLDLGFDDPGKTDASEAVDQWIEISTRRFGRTGNALLAQLHQICTWYLVIFSARYADLVREKSAEAEKLLASQLQMEAALDEIDALTNAIEKEREAEATEYFPQQTAERSSAPKAGDSLVESSELTARMRKIDTALATIQDACNARIGTGAAMDDLLAEIDKLTAEADSLRIPIYSAKVRLARAYLLGHLGRAEELRGVAGVAREKLLAGRAPSLTSFSEGSERITFLDTYRRESDAAIMVRDFDALAKVCTVVICDFETMRYRVADLFRSAALLSVVVEFYERAIFADFKRERWESMLSTIELVKARSSIRNAHSIRAVETTADQSGQIAELTTEFARLSGGGEAVAQQRRQIWDLLSVLRANQRVASLPEFSLGGVQQSLREDEALVGYYWMSESVFLTICVDRTRCVVERIILTTEQADEWQELFACIRNLKTAAGRSFDKAVEKAGLSFLPAQVREFLSDKERVIFSPHRSLHLFPFHAIKWDQGEYFGTRFAMRYVPNFSSVMLPWIRKYERRFFGVAIEHFANSAVPPLAQTETDLVAIEKNYQQADHSVAALSGAQANQKNFATFSDAPELTRARCVHFGTHGFSVLSSPDEPLDARILLRDGALDCMDIAQLSLAADVVVLCACESGQQAMELRFSRPNGVKGVPGDEIFGLQSALFQAGARCVLGSLWLVETESSSKLIKLFHERYAQGAEAEVALRDALRAYLVEPGNAQGVFYWAPYFLSCVGMTTA